MLLKKKLWLPKLRVLKARAIFPEKKKNIPKIREKIETTSQTSNQTPSFHCCPAVRFWGKKNVGNFHGGVVKTVHIQPSVKELGKSELYVDVFFAILAKGRKGNVKTSEVCLSVKIKAKTTMSMDDSFRKKRRKKESSCYCALGGIMLKFKPHPFGGTVHPPELWCGWHKRSQNESPSRCTNTGLKGGTKSFSTHMSLDFPRPDRDLPSF